MLMRKLIKTAKAMAAVLAAGWLLMLYHPMTVQAGEGAGDDAQNSQETMEEYDPNGSGVVWSEPEVEGWTLSWVSEGFFDTLVSAADGTTTLYFTYNEDGTRSSKENNGVVTNYYYDSDERIIAQETEGSRIEFLYDGDGTYGKRPLGFVYDDVEYEYLYDGIIIEGIALDGRQLVKYEYDGDYMEHVWELDEAGNWIDRAGDGDFIGNINPIRFTGCYYDKETEWYFAYRYYSAFSGRYIDGVSPERAEELKSSYPGYEVMAKTYTEGVNICSSKARSVQVSEEASVVRVLCLESHMYTEDLDCVAWVIWNRMNSNNADFAGVSTAYEVVSQPNQFSTYGKPEFYNFTSSMYPAVYSRASYWVYNLCVLETVSETDRVSGYGNQLYFSSVNSISGGVVDNGVYYKDSYNNDTKQWSRTTYSNLWMIPNGNMAIDSELQSKLDPYRGDGYNVFCEKVFTILN